jgi:hypothetical protein
MRLRRAVPKIPARPSVPPRLPLHKNPSLPTRSESTLPQLLIPLHFNSFISNACKKPGEGSLLPTPKFYNSSLPNCHQRRPQPASLRPRRNRRNPIPLIHLLHNLRTPRGGGARLSRRRSAKLSNAPISIFEFPISIFNPFPTETSSARPAGNRQWLPTRDTARAAARGLSLWSVSGC